MKLIFWGFLLDFLDFNLTLNGFSIDILPDFVGWLLVLFGARRMREENERFARMQPAAGVLFAVYLLSFLLQPFGAPDIPSSPPAAPAASPAQNAPAGCCSPSGDLSVRWMRGKAYPR